MQPVARPSYLPVIDVMRDFGATGNGSTDDYASIAAAITYAQSLTLGATIIFPTAVAFKCNTGIVIDISKVTLRGTSTKLDFSALGVSTTAITFNSTQTDPNIGATLGSLHFMEGFYLQGPGSTTAGVKGMDFTDGTRFVSNFTVRNCGFTGWETGMRIFTNAFCVNFNNCTWIKNSATNNFVTVLSIPSTGGNYGEGTVFTGCQFANLDGTVISAVGTANQDVYLFGCRLDYCKTFVDAQNGCAVTLSGCHLENSRDDDYWFKCSGADTLINISNCTLAITGNKSVFQIGNLSAAASTNGGYCLRDNRLTFAANTYSLSEVISGTGRVFVDGINYANGSTKPIISNNFNQWPWSGTFENASATAPLTLTGVTPPARSNTFSHLGTWSLKFPGAVGNTPTMTYLMPIRPGQIFQVEFWAKTINFGGTSATFYAEIDYTDSLGNVVFGGNIFSSTTDIVFTNRRLTMTVPCPPGATHAKLIVDIFGIAAGNPDAYVDDIIAEIL